jgi:peptidoglycan/LPS O-acetylase OafA/YrhL
MLLTLVGASVLVWMFGTQPEMAKVRSDGLSALAYVANWKTILSGASYWDAFGAPAPLSHLWSLAVEEQFYVVWPVVVVLFARIAAGRRLLWFVGVAAAVGCLASWVGMAFMIDPNKIDRVYLGTDARIGSILFGAALAVLGMLRPNWLLLRSTVAAQVVSLLCLVPLALMYWKVKYTEIWMYQGGFVVQVLLTVGVLFAAIRPGTVVHAVSNLKVLRWLGRLSYSVYLVHMPIYWLYATRTGSNGGWMLLAVGGGASLLVGSCMHYVVENPLRFRSWTLRESAVALGASAVFVAVAVSGPAWAASQDTSGLAAIEIGNVPELALDTTSDPVRPRVLMVGDSVAGNLAEGFHVYSEGRFDVFSDHVRGCALLGGTEIQRTAVAAPQNPDCLAWPVRWAETAEKLRPTAVVVHSINDAVPQLFEGEWITPCDAPFAVGYQARMELLMDTLDIGPDRVMLFVIPPALSPTTPAGGCLVDVMRAGLTGVDNVVLLDLAAELCSGTSCRTEIDGKNLYTDGVHYTVFGQELVSDQFYDLLEDRLISDAPIVPAEPSAADPDLSSFMIRDRLDLPPAVVEAEIRNGMTAALGDVSCEPGPPPAGLLTDNLLVSMNCEVAGRTIAVARYASNEDGERAVSDWHFRLNALNATFTGPSGLANEATWSLLRTEPSGQVHGLVGGPGRLMLMTGTAADEADMRALQRKLDASTSPQVWAP